MNKRHGAHILFTIRKCFCNKHMGGVRLKYCKEFMFQLLVLLTSFGLVFVAYELSMPVTVAAFSGSPAAPPEQPYNFFMNMLIPFILYMLSAGGLSYLILENVRMYKMTRSLKFMSKVLWTLWIIFLVLVAFLPVLLGFSLFFKGIWYVFIVILAIFSVLWLLRGSRVRP